MSGKLGYKEHWPQNDNSSHRSEWSSSRSLQTVNAGEGVEKREPSYTVGRNVNWHNHYEEHYADSFKN